MFLIHHFLENAAQKRPEDPAVLYGEHAATYADIETAANRIAAVLAELGVGKGDRVALLLENSVDYIAAYYGILKAGAVTVALYSPSTEKTFTYVLNDCRVKALISRPKFSALLAACREKLPALQAALWLGSGRPAPIATLTTVESEQLDSFPARKPDIALIDRDLASIVYTSGSTGDPRGAVLSHLNIVTNTRSIVSYLQLTPQDRIMVVLPFPYVYGKSLLNTHFFVGGSVLLDNRFAFPNVILKTMQQGEATGFSGVPSTFAILAYKSSVRNYEFPHLRYLTQAGGAMAPELTRQVLEIFHGKKLFIMYGATEASARLAYLEPDRLPAKIGSVGKAIPNVSLRLLKEDGSAAAPGEVGEIVAQGSNIMQGYWNQPAETAAVLDREGFHTGDLARMDEEGYLYIVGRKRDMIKSGANRVSAKEIEETLIEHPDVLESAVIGVADDILGEAIHAYIVGRNGGALEVASVLAFCRERLPEFKVPRKVFVLNALPKNASGKIMKEELRRMY